MKVEPFRHPIDRLREWLMLESSFVMTWQVLQQRQSRRVGQQLVQTPSPSPPVIILTTGGGHTREWLEAKPLHFVTPDRLEAASLLFVAG
eukprot:2753200-Rhodomonas_salina.3